MCYLRGCSLRSHCTPPAGWLAMGGPLYGLHCMRARFAHLAPPLACQLARGALAAVRLEWRLALLDWPHYSCGSWRWLRPSVIRLKGGSLRSLGLTARWSACGGCASLLCSCVAVRFAHGIVQCDGRPALLASLHCWLVGQRCGSLAAVRLSGCSFDSLPSAGLLPREGLSLAAARPC